MSTSVLAVETSSVDIKEKKSHHIWSYKANQLNSRSVSFSMLTMKGFYRLSLDAVMYIVGI